MGTRSLRERLAQFDRPRRPAGTPARDRSGAVAGLDALMERGGRWVGPRPYGYVRFERRLDPDALPGPPREVLPSEAWYRLGGPAAGKARPPWAVLDTETTGLESGVGILVFLVGAVIWDDAGARLVQYFLPEPAGEAVFLEAVVADLQGMGALLSFNGKSFDVPRLATRLAVNRIGADWLALPHLDLLHPCRRLLQGAGEDCRLGSVERVLLGRERVDDLAGWEVPEVYRSFLVNGADHGLGRILDHNEQDVRNLVWIAAVAADVFLGRGSPGEIPAAARLAVGRCLEARGRGETAELYFRGAVENGDAETCRAARWRLALLHRRRGEWERARSELERLVQRWPGWIDPRVELAKILEHRERDLAAARDVVHAALDALGGPHHHQAERSRRLRRELVHRLRRLERRLRR